MLYSRLYLIVNIYLIEQQQIGKKNIKVFNIFHLLELEFEWESLICPSKVVINKQAVSVTGTQEWVDPIEKTSGATYTRSWALRVLDMPHPLPNLTQLPQTNQISNI